MRVDINELEASAVTSLPSYSIILLEASVKARLPGENHGIVSSAENLQSCGRVWLGSDTQYYLVFAGAPDIGSLAVVGPVVLHLHVPHPQDRLPGEGVQALLGDLIFAGCVARTVPRYLPSLSEPSEGNVWSSSGDTPQCPTSSSVNGRFRQLG